MKESIEIYEASEFAKFTIHHAQIRDKDGKIIFDKKFAVHVLNGAYTVTQDEAKLLSENGFAHLFKKKNNLTW